MVPYIGIIHDRITLEIMRGCPNTCRFCQARQLYYPFRKREVGNILNLASQAYKQTGYEEISLGGLSVSDYPDIAQLLQSLTGFCKQNGVSISLPSIKPKTFLGGIANLIATIKKTGLTFAPEAGTERLRKVLGKDFDTVSFFKSLEQAYVYGYQKVKLYFMIGLPEEGESDLDSILQFASQVSELRRKASQGPAQINISINTLIPKPHTCFQWFKMSGIQVFKSKCDYIRAKLKNRRLQLNFHNPTMSFLEGILSRGDRRLSGVIEKAFEKGARFDGWSEHLKFEHWASAFRECGIEADFYLKERSLDELLPWDFLEMGVSKEALRAEYNKVIDIK
jgi:radical SAM superfamily enzyme YgiQ (UPF0313 family)